VVASRVGFTMEVRGEKGRSGEGHSYVRAGEVRGPEYRGSKVGGGYRGTRDEDAEWLLDSACVRA
jgi:hypothetical protein